MLDLTIKFDRVSVELKAEGAWDCSGDTVWFELTDVADLDRRWLHSILWPGETHPYGVNDLSCAYAYDLVIDGQEFKNFRLEAIDSSERFFVKGDYDESRHRLRSMG